MHARYVPNRRPHEPCGQRDHSCPSNLASPLQNVAGPQKRPVRGLALQDTRQLRGWRGDCGDEAADFVGEDWELKAVDDGSFYEDVPDHIIWGNLNGLGSSAGSSADGWSTRSPGGGASSPSTDDCRVLGSSKGGGASGRASAWQLPQEHKHQPASASASQQLQQQLQQPHAVPAAGTGDSCIANDRSQATKQRQNHGGPCRPRNRCAAGWDHVLQDLRMQAADVFSESSWGSSQSPSAFGTERTSTSKGHSSASSDSEHPRRRCEDRINLGHVGNAGISYSSDGTKDCGGVMDRSDVHPLPDLGTRDPRGQLQITLPCTIEDAEDVVISAGSANHEFGTCKPCAFIRTNVGCLNGVDCEFCHFRHSRRIKPRPCKGKRDRYRRIVAKMEQEMLDDDRSGDDFNDHSPTGVRSRSAGHASGERFSELAGNGHVASPPPGPRPAGLVQSPVAAPSGPAPPGPVPTGPAPPGPVVLLGPAQPGLVSPAPRPQPAAQLPAGPRPSNGRQQLYMMEAVNQANFGSQPLLCNQAFGSQAVTCGGGQNGFNKGTAFHVQVAHGAQGNQGCRPIMVVPVQVGVIMQAAPSETPNLTFCRSHASPVFSHSGLEADGTGQGSPPR